MRPRPSRLFIVVLVVLGVAAGPVRAQMTASAPPAIFSSATLSACAQLRDAALTDDYAYERIAELANTIGPRLSGSPGAAAAVQYVAAQLRALGVETRLQPVMVPHWVRGEETAELIGWPGQPAGLTQRVVVTALGASSATPQSGIDAPVLVVPDFATLEHMARDAVAGKIVLFDEIYDEKMAQAGFGGAAYGKAVAYRARGPAMASRLGAVAALIRSAGSGEYRLAHDGETNFRDAKPIPAGALAPEDADKIAWLAKRGTVRMHLVLTPRTLPDAPSDNVIGEIRGSQHPEEIVSIGGHLDSWDLGSGAIDDGAGVAIAMGALEVIHKLGLHPRRTIRVVAWMNEENGTRGGIAYAASEKANAANNVAAIESDSGPGHPLGVNVDASPKQASALRPLMQVLDPVGSTMIRRVDDSPETDVEPLSRLGVPTLGLLVDMRTYFIYHHTAADTLDKIDPHEMAQNVATMAVLAYGLADSDPSLRSL